MGSDRRITGIVAGFALVALIVATAAFAGPIAQPQQAEQQQQQAQQQQEQAEQQAKQAQQQLQQAEWQARQAAEGNFERAFALAQEYRVRPDVRFGAVGVMAGRSSNLPRRILAAAEELELTDAQQDSIRQVQRDRRRAQIRRDADIQIAELELEEMMEADAPDLTAVESQMRQIANLQVDGRIAGMRLERDIKALLTPEQLDKFDEMSPVRVVYEALRSRQSER